MYMTKTLCPKCSCIIGSIWLTLTESLEAVIFMGRSRLNRSLKLLNFKGFCEYNLLKLGI